MKKVVCMLMCLSMILGLALSGSAITAGEDAVQPEGNMINTISKDMITGEVTYSTYDAGRQTEVARTAAYLEQSNFDDLLAQFGNNPITPCNSIVGGVDNRTLVTNTQQFPNSAICYLDIRFGSNWYTGTAFMISKNVAVTAGHCLLDGSTWAEEVRVYPGKNGYWFWQNHYGTATSITIAAPTYDDYEDDGCDWGLIVIDQDLGNSSGWFSFTSDHGTTFPATFTLTGYPSSDQYHQYTCTDYVTNIQGPYLLHRMDASDGQSGSPVYDSNNVVHGVHVGSYGNAHNAAIQFTSEICNYFNSYIAAYA